MNHSYSQRDQLVLVTVGTGSIFTVKLAHCAFSNLILGEVVYIIQLESRVSFELLHKLFLAFTRFSRTDQSPCKVDLEYLFSGFQLTGQQQSFRHVTHKSVFSCRKDSTRAPLLKIVSVIKLMFGKLLRLRFIVSTGVGAFASGFHWAFVSLGCAILRYFVATV